MWIVHYQIDIRRPFTFPQMRKRECLLHIVYYTLYIQLTLTEQYTKYAFCNAELWLVYVWIDACVDVLKQKLSEAFFSLLYSACCEYNIRPIQMVHDDRCKTPLHHVRKQERLEQMKLVLQKQLERPTQNSWDAPLKTDGTLH